MKPTAWYDPSNGVVSTDRDCPLFTPLGQVWPLSIKREWVDLTDKVITKVVDSMPRGINGWMSDWDLYDYARAIEAKLKEKNA
jgi:hypothetical protein